MDYVKTFDNTINETLNQYMKKPTFIKGIVHLLLVLYAARIAPAPPTSVLKIFGNQYFKLFVFSLILWTAQVSPATSILIALAFMVSFNYLNQKPMWEFLDNVTAEAPSKDIAVASTSAVLNAQVNNTPVVSSVSQTPGTVVIQPQIVDTPAGKVVVNPSVVIAPAMVSNSSGETMMVHPEVSHVSPPSGATSSVAVPTVITTETKEQKTEPAPVQGCFNLRHFDMANVKPQFDDDYGTWKV